MLESQKIYTWVFPRMGKIYVWSWGRTSAWWLLPSVSRLASSEFHAGFDVRIIVPSRPAHSPCVVRRYVGSVLIALNPYMDLPGLSSSRTRTGSLRQYAPSADPHVHAIAQVRVQRVRATEVTPSIE